MKTILISGTYEPTQKAVNYHVKIWGANDGEPLQFITERVLSVSGYSALWDAAKDNASLYFDDRQFLDGAYCQYLDHLIRA